MKNKADDIMIDVVSNIISKDEYDMIVELYGYIPTREEWTNIIIAKIYSEIEIKISNN